jgi:hypothetical protein
MTLAATMFGGSVRAADVSFLRSPPPLRSTSDCVACPPERVSLPASDACEPAWSAAFGAQPGVGGDIFAMTSFTDANGPALYVAGEFITAGSELVNHIARWDGKSWTPLGGGLTDGPVGYGGGYALAVFDDGGGEALYVAGDFGSHIAKWDGVRWSSLGRGLDGLATALTVFDDGSGPALYVGGGFTHADGVPAKGVARWDGRTWSAVGGGVSGGTSIADVWALVGYQSPAGPRLVAAGDFTNAGGVPASRIAAWDGASWSPLGSGMNDRVVALAAFDDRTGRDTRLFAAGEFTSAGGAAADHVAAWDGRSWSALGAGVNGDAGVLRVVTDAANVASLWVGGSFDTAGGVAAKHVARWDGRAWESVGLGVDTPVRAIGAVVDSEGMPDIVVGQGAVIPSFDFPLAGTRLIHRWDGRDWSLITGGLDGFVHAVATYDAGGGEGPSLIVAGRFTHVGGVSASRVARWDGSRWHAMGSGMNATVWSLAVHDDGSGPALFAGGDFTTAGGTQARHIARWDGIAWSEPSGGVDSVFGATGDPTVRALLSFDDGSPLGPSLIVTGTFDTAGGVAANSVARWRGGAWSAMGQGIELPVTPEWPVGAALAVFDAGLGAGPQLYVAGSFQRAGGASVPRIARWDGTTWLRIGAPTASSVGGLEIRSLAVFDDGSGDALYAGGLFQKLGVGANLLRWDGAQWSMPWPVAPDARVSALATFDDGTGAGASLFAGGEFGQIGGQQAKRLARWDGAVWSSLDAVVLGDFWGASVEAITAIDAAPGAGLGNVLWIGGFFQGSVTGDGYLIRWQGCPETCAADLDHDGVVGGSDLAIVLGAWGTARGDVDGDGITGATDLALILGAWGDCP